MEHLPFLSCARERRRQGRRFDYDLLEEAGRDMKLQGRCVVKYNDVLTHGAQTL